MIQVAADPAFLEVLKTVGAPVATALGSIYFYHKFIAPKVSTEKEIREQHDHNTQEILFKLDLALTEHFDQLRRDLEHKIDKSIENGIQAYLFQRYEMQSRRKEK